MNPFERYFHIIDDYQAFKDILDKPLPVTVWGNPERIDFPQLEELLHANGFTPAAINWYAGGYKMPEEQRAGKRWEFFGGLYHIQEEAAMAPAYVLDPQPGEKVLDMCAAPGNKTAQMAFMMKQEGTIIANDLNSKRLGALKQTCDRLGVRNTTFCNFNAANIRREAGRFDKILVDVPCSCEGTTRKNLNAPRRAEIEYSRKQQGSQKAILSKAVQLCKPGGKILYATCTYAPEENEQVVNDVLTAYGTDLLKVESINIKGFKTSPGITQWENCEFDPQLKKAARIWPHHNDTGGFFMALIEKTSAIKDEPRQDEEPCSKNEEEVGSTAMDCSLADVVTRYGLSSDFFKKLKITAGNRQQINVANGDHEPPGYFSKGFTGLRFLDLRAADLKLTHPAALHCGAEAQKNCVELNSEQLEQYLQRRIAVLDSDDLTACKDEGFVLVRHKGFAVGLGVLATSATGHKTLKSQFPKTWSKRLYDKNEKLGFNGWTAQNTVI